MNNAWTQEYTRILLLIAAGLLIGLMTGYWVVAVLLPCSAYIGWTLVQLRAFERWIRRGAKAESAPNANGIWALIVQHVYRSQKRDTQHKNRLKQLLRRFESTISALPYATITLNEQQEIVWVNSAAAGTLGVSKYKDEGQRIDNLVRKPELQNVINSADASTSIQMVSPVDNNIVLMVTCVTFGDNQKLITAKDISQILAVQKLRKAFISNASHELRTPLTVISGYLEMMSTDSQLPKGMGALVDNAHEQSLRMVSILDDLLSLSKLVEKEALYSKDSGEPVDIIAITNKLLIDHSQTGDHSQMGDSYTLESSLNGPIQVKGVETELYSLCENLISNAIKYSPPGSVVKIDWTVNDQGWAGLQIIDCGEGIAEEDIPRLTERFYRVNTVRDREVSGTGLGLSIVKHILENHGGYLDIQSELGRGSVFTAYFPEYRLL
ncbi:MAG: phosphate regulon sensor histidine kinase PhoR [Psychrosphaera sp.]|nr:phosphate regulon sensor histidine kinase PhoR [Psychrosphaera sp.]